MIGVMTSIAVRPAAERCRPLSEAGFRRRRLPDVRREFAVLENRADDGLLSQSPGLAHRQRIIEIVAEQLGIEKALIKPNVSFNNDLGADSLETVELIMELEEAASSFRQVNQRARYFCCRRVLWAESSLAALAASRSLPIPGSSASHRWIGKTARTGSSAALFPKLEQTAPANIPARRNVASYGHIERTEYDHNNHANHDEHWHHRPT